MKSIRPHPLTRPILRASLLLAAAIALCGPCQARAGQQNGPTPFPDPKDDAAWPGKGPVRVYPYMNDNRRSFWSVRDQNQGAVVFTGDSLIGGWKDPGKAFPGVPKIANRGIGGDNSRDILFRFQEDVLDLHPKAIFMIAGSNDLSANGKADDVILNLTLMLDMAEKQDPGLPVILGNVPPRDNAKAPVSHASLAALNERIAAFAKSRKNVTFVDIYSLFALPDGNPDPRYFRGDRLHFNPAGYAKLADALRKIPVLSGAGH